MGAQRVCLMTPKIARALRSGQVDYKSDRFKDRKLLGGIRCAVSRRLGQEQTIAL